MSRAAGCGLHCDPEYGGQGLPLALADAGRRDVEFGLHELGLMPAAEFRRDRAVAGARLAASRSGSISAKLVSGEWTGTMNLTEPQAGSDLGALRTRAVRRATSAGASITGSPARRSSSPTATTICADNIVHMVLARTPDAPPGSRGISLFLVPKFLPDADGQPGAAQRLCARSSLEQKLGIHASPTCVMSYGEDEGAVGWRIGEENRGLECMFTMMNSERLQVGVQGVAIAERAYQQARDYARTRVQGRPLGDAARGRRRCRSSTIPMCAACCCGCAPRPRRCGR